MTQQDKSARTSGRKPPKKISPKYLENSALAYLQRYASSSENLRRVLMRRVKKSCAFHGSDIAEAGGWVEALVERYKASGLINDTEYARGRVASLRRQGRSRQAIGISLKSKGLPAEIAQEALTYVDAEKGAENPELEAARTFARKKRLGPFRKNETSRDEEYLRKQRQRDLASMARAGFAYDLALKVLETGFDEDFNSYD